MLRTPDGHGRLELATFHTPKAISVEPRDAPANTRGIRRITFAADDIEDVVARLRTHDAELVGELAQYEDPYRLCYVRGAEGIVVGLANSSAEAAQPGTFYACIQQHPLSPRDIREPACWDTHFTGNAADTAR